MRLVQVSKIKDGELPFTRTTFYKWHHTKKHPEMFVKFGGGLFIDLDALDRVIEAGRQAPLHCNHVHKKNDEIKIPKKSKKRNRKRRKSDKNIL